jgi:hypothetical protein
VELREAEGQPVIGLDRHGQAAQHKAITKQARNTDHIERFNHTLRQRVSRLVRDTLAFSKKLAKHIGAIKYFICHYNLTKAAALPVEHYLIFSTPWVTRTPDPRIRR